MFHAAVLCCSQHHHNRHHRSQHLNTSRSVCVSRVCLILNTLVRCVCTVSTRRRVLQLTLIEFRAIFRRRRTNMCSSTQVYLGKCVLCVCVCVCVSYQRCSLHQLQVCEDTNPCDDRETPNQTPLLVSPTPQSHLNCHCVSPCVCDSPANCVMCVCVCTCVVVLHTDQHVCVFNHLCDADRVCVFVCVCVYVERERERERDDMRPTSISTKRAQLQYSHTLPTFPTLHRLSNLLVQL